MTASFSGADSNDVTAFLVGVERRNPGEPEFLQAVREVAESVVPFVGANPRYQGAALLERLTEPDRVITFRVTWTDDAGEVRVNRAWRVQFNNALGAYKGGLRFHPSVTQSVLKFLGFEQCFKNALTGLPMGGAKGGSNFNPRGKSDAEVHRFCQSLMTELHRHIGEDVDVPAGDIGVGGREVSYLFGHYKRLSNRFVGTLTGKGLGFGGSEIRTEATGYGVLYFTQEMLRHAEQTLEGKTVAISGSGNVALYAAEKALRSGARVVSLSDSGATIVDKEGLDEEKLAYVKDLKEVRRGRIAEYVDHFDAQLLPNERPWRHAKCDIALPCATQNELDEGDARALLANGCRLVAEGANMPTTPQAVAALQAGGVLFGPAKAANAGGVAVSGLEQAQNAQRIYWTAEEVDSRLREIMASIHEQCLRHGELEDGGVDYLRGANIGGFVRLADAMLAYGPT